MIQLDRLHVRAGTFALTDLTFTIPSGAWAIVLGPAGAGKTTLLETIAGVRVVSGGRLRLRGTDVTHAPAERRGVGIVYQRGLLFPHLSVSGNMAYGTRDLAHVARLAALFGAEALRDRPVASLSGGERQIVALVRALARRPDVLLLDEPFSALDPRGRSRVRRALQGVQREQGVTVLQVTHDFVEAGTVGDLALLMEAGRVVQADVPEVLFRHPATVTAAEFLGAENIYAGTVTIHGRGSADGPRTLLFDAGGFSLVAVGERAAGPAHAIVRGEDVSLAPATGAPAHGSARNVLAGRVIDVATSGVITRVTLDIRGAPLVSVITTAAARDLSLHAGVAVVASIKATSVHVC